METDKKTRRSKMVYGGVIALLILIFIVGFVYGLNSVLSMEGSFPPNDQEKSEPPKTAQEAVELLDKAVDHALAQKPKMTRFASFGIFDSDNAEDEKHYTLTAGETVKETLLFILDPLKDKLNESFNDFNHSKDGEDFVCDFGAGFESALKKPSITEGDLAEDFTCSYIYYECLSCGVTSNDPRSKCEDCGSLNPYQEKYRDNYTLRFPLKTDDGTVSKNFSVRTQDEIIALFGDELKDVFEFTEIRPVATEYSVNADVARLPKIDDEGKNLELKSLSYVKNVQLHIAGKFTGKYEALGEVDLTVWVAENEVYSFTWPGIELSAHKASVEPGESDNLLATLTFPGNPKQENVKWSSSDENLVTVDDEGYYKAKKKTSGEAEITASYYDEVTRKTYFDKCRISVKYDVESASLNKRKLTMTVGGTFQLKAKISPSNATYKDVTWYTDDPTKATVDQNGLVTAVAPGKVTIYALTNDLYYKASCEVTVE